MKICNKCQESKSESEFNRDITRIDGRRATCKSCRSKGRGYKTQNNLPIEQRFWPKVDRRGPDECWEWLAGKDKDGYGKFRVNTKSSFTRSNRVAYELSHHENPGSKFVLHKCDNPGCCNPSHLFLGTCTDNSKDMVNKGRSLKNERNPKAKLTQGKVAESRQLYLSGQYTKKYLASLYDMSESAMSYAIDGKTWEGIE